MRLLAVFVVVVAVGCGAEPPPDLHPLTGTVTYKGRLVTAGGLLFAPEEGGWGGVVVNANVEPDGTFAAQTEKVTGRGTTARPGVRVGRFKVTYNPPGDGQLTGGQCGIPGAVEVKPGGTTVALVLPEATPPVATPATGR